MSRFLNILLIRFQAHQGTAIRLGVDIKLFETAVAAHGPITVAQLADHVSIDYQLVCRF